MSPIEKRWAFLSSHGLVLLAIAEDPSATLRQIGDRVGITERAAQNIVSDLVAGGYVRRRRDGRRNVYTINVKKRLRHPLSRDRRAGELLQLLMEGPGKARK